MTLGDWHVPGPMQACQHAQVWWRMRVHPPPRTLSAAVRSFSPLLMGMTALISPQVQVVRVEV